MSTKSCSLSLFKHQHKTTARKGSSLIEANGILKYTPGLTMVKLTKLGLVHTPTVMYTNLGLPKPRVKLNNLGLNPYSLGLNHIT